ncbi:calcium-translocating P-type ATPase [Hyaloscypha variabilis F]|uniref:Calcium-transporting ATPase n=1 Tax=Hyaloscypha variabilis (strain UAMH 11265 / GT02V1 / F) TaxID=1149755 RepID=A0A2J6RUD3_HYAVF|nr:calcium-translocating P-type ATPase [Hyaloscypha variabilis F]
MAGAQEAAEPEPVGMQRQRAPTITIVASTGDPEPPPSSDYHSETLFSSAPNSPLLSTESLSSPHSSSQTSARHSTYPDSGAFLAIPGTHSRRESLDQAHSVSSYGGETLLQTSTVSDYGGTRRNSGASLNGTDHDFSPLIMPSDEEDEDEIVGNPFPLSPKALSILVDSKSIPAFRALGGLRGITRGLRTDSKSGLSLSEGSLDENESSGLGTGSTSSRPLDYRTFSAAKPRRNNGFTHGQLTDSELYVDRKRIFGENRLPEKKSKSLLEIMWITFNDKVLIILSIVAAISLALGLYQDSVQSDDGPKVRWVEGVTIMVAVVIVVVVGSLNDYQKERQFIKLNKTKDDRVVKAIRSGKSMEISVYDILAGDVLYIEPGDLIPADGIFISGHNVVCDESSATGESDQMKKTSGDEVMAHIETGASLYKLDPFIISGSKVLEGVGTYMVTAVGVHSSYGKLMMSFTSENEPTPLQTKLNTLASQISKIGCAIALLLFIVLVIRFLVHLPNNTGTPSQKGQEFLQMLIVSITIIVIAVPEGLPLAVILALAFAVTRMLKDNNLVRVLRACEAMGNITSVCTDKTGTLTLNKMTVVAGTLSDDFRFAEPEEIAHRNEEQVNPGAAASQAVDVPMSTLASRLSAEIKELLVQSIAINSTAFESREDGKQTFIGSKTETALLSFSSTFLGMRPVSEERANAEVVQMIPFDSRRKCMAAVIRISDFHYRLLVKGAPEILLRKCTRIVTDIARPLAATELSDFDSMTRTIDTYATKSLRTIAMAYRDFSYWPPYEAKTMPNDPKEAVFEDVFQDMVFLGVVGIRDPVRLGVKEAVAQCQHAGVCVRMVTGDSVKTAVAVAQECGIYTPGGRVIEGPEFRKLSHMQMDEIIPDLQVLARSSPEDKRILVKRLKALGETVAVTGDGTNDGPALKTADVGFSMGIAGTEVAKEASSIVLMDDNFASIVKALEWGRTINDAVKKFLQFQLTVNVTAVILTFVSAIASNKEEPILTPVQLLWVNLIMDTFAALALATDPPPPSILDRKPEPRSTPLITLKMWKMIIGQSIYQLAVTLALNFAGNEILGYKTEVEKDHLETLVFNIYVWMQFFNQYNNRRLDNKFNILEGIHRNYFFIGINIIMVSGQLLIVNFGGEALSTHPLNATQWLISLALGALSLLVGILVRLIPDSLILALVHMIFPPNKSPYLTIPITPRFRWYDPIENVRDELYFFKFVRGRHRWSGFFAAPSATPKTPILSRSSTDNMDSGSSVNLPPGSTRSLSPTKVVGSRSRSRSALAPAAVMAGVIAGSIAGWNPREIGGEEE